eukprot:m.235709 g.235709  ORF g.235709 m.235709 type:complete len:83 (-) comp22484_c4_seq4:174-422(-)
MPPKERTLTEIRDVDGATYFLDTAWCTASASFDLFLTDGAEIADSRMSGRVPCAEDEEGVSGGSSRSSQLHQLPFCCTDSAH